MEVATFIEIEKDGLPVRSRAGNLFRVLAKPSVVDHGVTKAFVGLVYSLDDGGYSLIFRTTNYTYASEAVEAAERFVKR